MKWQNLSHFYEGLFRRLTHFYEGLFELSIHFYEGLSAFFVIKPRLQSDIFVFCCIFLYFNWLYFQLIKNYFI